MIHHPTHWIAVAVVSAVALLTLTEVHGQRMGGAAYSEPKACCHAAAQAASSPSGGGAGSPAAK